MKFPRFGCLTTTGVVSALIAVFTIVGSALAVGGTMYSPGDLNAVSGSALGGVTSHAEIAGDCKACHSAPWEKTTMDDRCLACHADVAEQLPDPVTVHGGMLEANQGAKCRDCHPEHNGTDALLTRLANWAFPHQVVNFSLEGHQLTAQKDLFQCADCHGEDVTKFDQATCTTCHSEIDVAFTSGHTDLFGGACLDCHDGVDAFGSDFSHDAFAFKLAGKHSAADCSKCHSNSHTVAALQETKQDCFSCHKADDPHKAKLGTDCASCHSPEGWKPSSFDHVRSDFKLEGAHATVECSKCHLNNDFKGTPKDCFSCHQKDDNHKGQLGTDCATCHEPGGWKNVTFDHNTTSFKLTGLHSTTVCTACHVNGVFKGTATTCYACHAKKDNHKGAFGTNCELCHSTSGWKNVTFNHSVTRFPLTGLHSTVECKACHLNGDFKNTSTVCFDCHSSKDKHKGQFGKDCASCHNSSGWKNVIFDHSKTAFMLTDSHKTIACSACHVNGVYKGTPKDCYSCHAKVDNHKGKYGTNCAQCHKPTKWLDVFYDHSKTAFPLSGAHTTVTCFSCHKNGVFKGTARDCYSCHAAKDNHKGQFGTNCAQCHKPTKWLEVFYDHSGTAFPLTGSHTTVTCKACHVNGTYKGTPKDCYSCHAPKDKHNGQYGRSCETCHKPTKWVEITFDHNKTFPLTDSHKSVTCLACHRNGVFKGTPRDCYSCHAAKDNHKGQFGTNCAQCHKPTKWSEVSYDHSGTAFPLTGSHTTVTCKACHVNGIYKGTPKDCYSCHAAKDNHKGQLGTNCAQCHKTTKWSEVSYDHSGTAFPLTGSHTSVTCKQCHVNGNYKGTPKDCYSCHAPKDKHNGQYGKACETCHKPTQWSEINFNHNNTAFPLVNSHASVACLSCHKNGVFKGTPRDCYSCHAPKDKHNGQFGTNCAQCHKPTKWSDVTFNHATTAFPLIGKHSTVACLSCHVNGVYKGTAKDCYACHASKDKHNGQFGTNCARCHTPTGWSTITFDHAQSAFPLSGAHVNTACTKCHINNVFAGTPKECVSCHLAKDPHAGMAGTNCGSCHATSAWKPASMSHTFPLTHHGSKAATCVTCHPSQLDAYTCYGCHEHTSSGMISKHKKVQDFSETTCADCHPNGR